MLLRNWSNYRVHIRCFSRGRMGKTRSIERRWQPDWAPCLLRSLDSLEVLMVRNVVLGHLRTLYR